MKNYAEQIKPIIDFKSYQKPRADKKSVTRIWVKKGEMTTHLTKKNKFSQLNDKRFYFPNPIISLPFGQLTYKIKLTNIKKIKGKDWKICPLKKNERLNVLDNILKQVPKIVSLTTEKFDRNTNFLHKEKINKSTLDYILEAGWKNTHMTNSSLVTSLW